MKVNLKPNLFYLIAGVILGVFLVSQLAFRKNDVVQLDPKASVPSMPYKWHPPKMPDQLSFAGEAVPLDRWEVREEMDRQLLLNYYWQNNILYIMKLASRYFPLIEERLRANGIPDDFKYLCIAESNLQNVTSRAGAVGFWQFMSYTAPGFNLEISKEVDQRYDVLRSTDAACTYLRQAYAKFGSWTAAAASYNCGQGGYASHSSFQQTKYYYDLLLPEETNRYIFRILTFKYLIENATQMGYLLEPSDLYAPIMTKNVTISSSIPNLADYAIKNGTTYKRLKLLNPWLRSKSLIIKPGKSYILKLPATS